MCGRSLTPSQSAAPNQRSKSSLIRTLTGDLELSAVL